jgi:hypothetical protein
LATRRRRALAAAFSNRPIQDDNKQEIHLVQKQIKSSVAEPLAE